MHKLGRRQCCCENVHCSDEDSQLNTWLKETSLTKWRFQLGAQAGSTLEGQAEGEQQRLCREIIIHLCTRTLPSLNWLSSGQPATWTVRICLAPDVF